MSTAMQVFKRQVKLGVVVSALLATAVACSRNTLTCAEGNTSESCRIPAADATGSVRPQRAAGRATTGSAPPIVAPPATMRSAPAAPPAAARRRAEVASTTRAARRPAVCDDVTGSLPGGTAASAVRLDAHWELDERNSVAVRDGDTLRSLAERHHIPESVMREANGLGPYALQPGQRIVIPRYNPYPPKTAMQRSMPATAGRPTAVEHIVAPGETLSAIARRYGGSVAAIARFNGIADAARIRFGDVILIPPG